MLSMDAFSKKKAKIWNFTLNRKILKLISKSSEVYKSYISLIIMPKNSKGDRKIYKPMSKNLQKALPVQNLWKI